MDRLIQAPGAVAQTGRGDHADRAGDHGGLVGDDVAEHVLGNDDVELAGVLDNLHGTVVHEHLAVLHLGVLSLQAVHDRTPEAAGIQHVGLIHAAELLAALHGRLEADAANALDFMLRVGHGIHSLLLAVLQRVSLVLAEVDAADELTHDDEVDALCHDLGLEGAGRGQLGPDLGRAVVGVEAHAGAETEQSLFGALLTGQTLPLWAADCAQKDAVGREALVQLMLGQRVAVLVDGLAAHCGVGIVEGVAVLFGHLIENAEGLLHDLGAGAVAPDDSNVFFHSYGHPFFYWTTASFVRLCSLLLAKENQKTTSDFDALDPRERGCSPLSDPNGEVETEKS